MPYGIELSVNNGTEGFQAPVMPGQIEIGNGTDNKVYDIVSTGEINVIKNPKLSEYAFSSIFPAQRYPFVTTRNLGHPIEYVRLILKWMESMKPIHFIFISDTFDINTLASIEDFTWKEVAGGSGDIEYSLKLKAYVPYSVRRVPVAGTGNVMRIASVSPSPQVPDRPNEQQPPKTYTLVAGDTLWAVAQRFLGNGARWPEIQSLNGITDAEIKRLQIGRVLRLP